MPDEMREQIPKVRRVVAALGIPVYEMEGFEADDVIATLVGQAEAADLETTILTGDLDMLQLVSERTKLLVSLRGRHRQHGGLRPRPHRRALGPAARPDARLQGAQGRPDRQHPGRARGRREDRGQARRRTYGTLDAMYEAIDDVQPEKLRAKLIEAKETVLESRELMRARPATCR